MFVRWQGVPYPVQGSSWVDVCKGVIGHYIGLWILC